MKFVVLSRSSRLYSTRRLVEAARRRGHTVQVTDTLQYIMGVSTRKPVLLYRGKPLGRVDIVVPRIGASITEFGLSVVRHYEMLDVFCVNESQAIARSRDKLRSIQILSAHDVGLVPTAFARGKDQLRAAINLVGGPPVVVKLLQGTQGAGVVLAESRQAAESVVDAFSAINQAILVQAFVPEAGGQDVRAVVVGGKVVAAMTRKAIEGEFRSNLHRGGSAKPAKLTVDERRTAVRAARALGLSVAGVDMLRSNSGPLVMEVNSSPGLEGIERATGIDVAGAIVEWAARRARPGPMRDRVGR
jgi:ribosomal protein S6--L-glutamate ligase